MIFFFFVEGVGRGRKRRSDRPAMNIPLARFQQTASVAKVSMQGVLDSLYHVFIGRWVWALFREGPAWAGGWSGLPEADMCARMAPASEAFDWLAADGHTVAARCLHMVARAHRAYTCVVHTALYALALLWAWSLLKHLHLAWLWGRQRHQRRHRHPQQQQQVRVSAPAGLVGTAAVATVPGEIAAAAAGTDEGLTLRIVFQQDESRSKRAVAHQRP